MAPAQFMALRILSGKGEVQFMLFRKELNALEKAPVHFMLLQKLSGHF